LLETWLSPQSVDEFIRVHLGQEPLARPDVAAGASPLLSWDTLEAHLQRARGEDVLVVRGGRLSGQPPPRTLAGARALLERGTGFVVRASERRSPEMAAFAAGFAPALPGPVKLQLFATPPDAHGFGWHWDAEHVFIAQTAGVKDYYFRPNSVSGASGRPDFREIARETSAISMARLHPGDWLYIPARWWHVAVCREDSLSISVGIALAAACLASAR
jgi:hypothetical protein